jgi:hypothetical protein
MALYVKTGSYVGNGSVRSITGAGFIPKVLMIISDCTTATGNAAGCAWKTSDMGSYSYLWGDNDRFLGISSMDADGFSLTAADFANKTGANYHWILIGGDDVKVGTYTGNNTDNRNITGVGFQPEWVLLQTTSNSHSMHKMNSTGASTDSSQFGATVANMSNIIQALQADGFQVGKSISYGVPNATGATCYYAAIKDSAFTYNANYSGNGLVRSLTGFGFQSSLVFIKNASTQQACLRSGTITGTSSGLATTNNGFTTTGITAVGADGISLGVNAVVNSNAQVYHLFAIGPGDAIPSSGGGFPGVGMDGGMESGIKSVGMLGGLRG